VERNKILVSDNKDLLNTQIQRDEKYTWLQIEIMKILSLSRIWNNGDKI
jgi:hypothetical protein